MIAFSVGTILVMTDGFATSKIKVIFRQGGLKLSCILVFAFG
jgi:hypothetical protein